MTPPKMPRAAYSPDSAAEFYDTSRDTILRAIKAGALAAKKIGNKFSISARALEDWHDSLPDA